MKCYFTFMKMIFKRINNTFASVVLLYCLLLSIEVLSNQKAEVSYKEITYRWIAYMEELIKEQVLDNEDLLRFEQELRTGKIVNPLEAKKIVSPATWIHFQELEQYLKLNHIDRLKFLSWVQDTLRQRGQIAQAQVETQNITEYPFRRMVFYPIPAGAYALQDVPNPEIVELDAFDMMSTLVTQWQWAMVMGENPSILLREQSLFWKGKREHIEMQPDHPVEFVSYFDITNKFLPKLNKLSKSDVEFMKKLIPDHCFGDKFDIPTEYQWEYVARNLGEANEQWHFGNDPTKLVQYAWYSTNSSDNIQAVAQLLPLYINNNPFYDLYGNVDEWMKNWHDRSLQGGKNPQGPKNGSRKSIRGGHFRSVLVEGLTSFSRSKMDPAIKSEEIGFRLIRYRAPE